MKRIFTVFSLLMLLFQVAQSQTPACSAAFTIQYQQAPNIIKFIPAFVGDSVNTQHQWFFGDGSAVNNYPSPTHTYLNPGVYTVYHTTLHHLSNNTVCMDSAFMTITIQSSCNLIPNYTVRRDSLHYNTFYFTNTTTPLSNTDSIRWTFGDGTASSDLNPTHTYSTPGTYRVCLFVKQSATCAREYCSNLSVGTTCNMTANFNWMQDSASNVVYFQNATTPLQTNDSTIWIFGDGSTGNTYNATHTYANAGTYQVCMRTYQRVNGLITGCYSDKCYTITVLQRCNLSNVYFTMTSTPNGTYNFIPSGVLTTDSVRWTFGDGSTANTLSASHFYTASGTYQVCLRVVRPIPGGNCVQEYCRNLTVSNTNCNLMVSFTADTLHSPNTYLFTNTSTPLQPTDSIRWSFGDGTSGTGMNADHTYRTAGTYSVCLTVIKRDSLGQLTTCVRTSCQPIIVYSACNIQASFTTNTTNNGYSFYFVNTSSGLQPGDSIRWNFGDGTTSTVANPVHTYNAYGVYNVCLRIKRATAAGTPPCVSEYCHTVNAVNPCNIQANYTWHADSMNANHIYFNNQSVAPATGTTAIWYFGDGTSFNGWNADHIYRTPGVYRVCLRIQNTSTCVVYQCDSITVQAGGCYSNAEFYFYRSNVNSLIYQFNPRAIDSNWTYQWNFGDSTTSSDIRPAHSFSGPGTYQVCLTVTNGNCTSTFCRQVYIAPPVDCNSIQVSYVYRQDPYILNKYYFYTLANYPVLAQTWTISKVGGNHTDTLRSFNPIYFFQDTGHYLVCLKAFTMGGCIKDTCQSIYIGQVPPAPTTCFISAYPNPVSSNVYWNVYLSQSQNVTITVYNSMNTVVKQQQYAGLTGNNNFSMYVGNLVAGNYYVRITYGNSACYSRFMKY